MDSNNYDDTIPLAYLNNQNPYAYCTNYHKNAINMQDRRTRLTALQRIQPSKVSFRMPLKHVEKEKEYLIDHALEAQRKELIKKGLHILQVDYHDSPEMLFEQNFHNDDILDIAIQLKKLKLFYHQKRLRSKVSAALASKLGDEMEGHARGVLEVDNLKDALIYCKLQDLYGKE